MKSLIFFFHPFPDNSWSGVFEPGVQYYATVKACNRAGMCSLKSSNGVIMDNSPPVPGLIHIGFSGYHEPFSPYKYVRYSLKLNVNDFSCIME